MCWRGGLARTVEWSKAGARLLKAFSPFAWVPILTVGVLSAIMTYKNLSFQKAGNRPEMIFNRVELRDPYDDGILYFGMLNVGTRSAYDYNLTIKTVQFSSDTVVVLLVVNSSNPVRRQGSVSAEPRLDMSKYLDVMALCATYRDDDGKDFNDPMFVYFPTMTRGLKKDKGGGGQYLAASVSPDELHKLEKLEVCKE